MKSLKLSILSIVMTIVLAFCGCAGGVVVGSESESLSNSSKYPDVSQVVFNDLVSVYNGFEQKATVNNLPEGVEVEYENNVQKNAGEYQATATLLYQGEEIKTLTATINIAKRSANVTINDQQALKDQLKEVTYTTKGVLAGDDLGLTFNYDKASSGIKEITATYTNKNYDVTFESGEYLITEYLFDSSFLSNYASAFLPNYAPFSLYDTTRFEESVITSISFPYYGLTSGYNLNSQNLYMPVYIVSSDFTTKQEDCTVENGKKINLDFTGKLNGVQMGDWVTVDGLNIEVGKNETLAFGDSSMAVLPMFLRDNTTFGFWNRIFGNKGQNKHSLIFKIEGYSVKTESDNPTNPDDGKTYISFLGDSISTYAGWSNNTSYNTTIGSNAIWFPNNNYYGANMTVDKTWWHMTYTELGYELCVNNSWSGSVVNTAQTYNVRANNLYNTSTQITPDVIVIFMGVNDYAANTQVGTYTGTTTAPINPTNFSEAYGRLLTNIFNAYDDVDVYCCTFLTDRKRFNGSNNLGLSEAKYNEAIATIANNFGAKVIDLYNGSGINAQNIGQYTVDNLHPNAEGMKLIKNTVTSVIKSYRK